MTVAQMTRAQMPVVMPEVTHAQMIGAGAACASDCGADDGCANSQNSIVGVVVGVSMA